MSETARQPYAMYTHGVYISAVTDTNASTVEVEAFLGGADTTTITHRLATMTAYPVYTETGVPGDFMLRAEYTRNHDAAQGLPWLVTAMAKAAARSLFGHDAVRDDVQANHVASVIGSRLEITGSLRDGLDELDDIVHGQRRATT